MPSDFAPASLFAQGNALLERGATHAAIDAFQRCLALAPDNAAVLFNLGNALLRAGRRTEAVDAYVACLRLAPELGAAYVNLADTLRSLTLLAPARQMAELGVRLLPDRPEALKTLAHVLHDAAAYEAAIELYERVLAAHPGDPGALTSLGNSLRAAGRLPEALAVQERAVAAAPGDPSIRFNRALTYLASGDFAVGWAEHEVRWQRAGARRRSFRPAWRGEPVAGRTVLLHAEQGLGDTLQFVRFAPLLADRGARVVLEVQAPLLRLLRTSMPFAEVIVRGAEPPAFNAHCPLMSLPLGFGTTLDSIPRTIPYLRAEADDVALWREKSPPDGRLRVGLVWAGGAHTDNAGAYLIDQRRSLRPADLAPLGSIAGVQWISLQKDRREAAWPDGPVLTDRMDEVTDFADTAALIGSLDLVVAVDTAVAHLAGGLGCPVWLLSRFDGCWRWMHGRDDSPWYPGMRIYRQERPLDWSAVIARVRADLIAVAEHWQPGAAARVRSASPGGSSASACAR